MKRADFSIILPFLCLLLTIMTPLAVLAQRSAEEEEKARDGIYIITMKSPERQRMAVDELIRDRDLNPSFLYRVKTGGYIAFDEKEWVEKIEFRVFEKPVTELPEYKRFSTLLTEINGKVWLIKQTLGKYDLLALRLMNICDRSRFSSLEAIDDNILQQLTIYRKLLLLRALVVNALNRFVKERACTDLFSEYQKTLCLYTKQLGELTKNYSRLARKALYLVQEVRPETERKQPDEKRPAPPTKSPD
ncbi:MAG: hypothetical protein FJY85_17865 [Deltaproteobacteria bacterium]|nr:hypothetical protein [Deltaproteobacteria bacterium]